MLFSRRRTATVVAASVVELASLSKADFVKVIQEFPELAPEFEKNIGGYAVVRIFLSGYVFCLVAELPSRFAALFCVVVGFAGNSASC